jgi:hypothetical protein
MIAALLSPWLSEPGMLITARRPRSVPCSGRWPIVVLDVDI